MEEVLAWPAARWQATRNVGWCFVPICGNSPTAVFRTVKGDKLQVVKPRLPPCLFSRPLSSPSPSPHRFTWTILISC